MYECGKCDRFWEKGQLVSGPVDLSSCVDKPIVLVLLDEWIQSQTALSTER
ncbi:hypothetical protein Plhal703r1_c16g0077651 [Plasmopara halstedii]